MGIVVLVLIMPAMPDWLISVLFLLIPLGFLGVFLGVIWFLTRFLWRTQSNDPQKSQIMGWKIFVTCGFIYAFTPISVFYGTAGGVCDSRYWVSGIFFFLPYALACLGFVQILGGTSFTRLPQHWESIECWRRFSLVAFITGSVWVLILCLYYLAWLNISNLVVE